MGIAWIASSLSDLHEEKITEHSGKLAARQDWRLRAYDEVINPPRA